MRFQKFVKNWKYLLKILQAYILMWLHDVYNEVEAK